MLKPYDLLENVLIDIEEGIRKGITSDILADKYSLSYRHLHRLFKFAFRQSLADYIRSRKLTASLDDLLKTDANLLDIALSYGFCYEQSYINAFKREFGITPGDFRKSGHIVKVKPPLLLFDSNKIGNGLIFGPDIVMVPQFRVVGKKQRVPFHKILTMDMPIAKHFFYNERQNITNAVNPDTLIYLCNGDNTDGDYIYLMPSVQVKSLENIPEGYEPYTFPTSLCANFRFINCNFDEVNMHTADDMFKAIDDFNGSEEQKYFIRRGLNIDKFDLSNKNEGYCQWEWFAPVIEKTSLNIAPFNHSGIKKVYEQEFSALRFIGKKCIETPETADILNLLDNWLLNDWFNAIEKLSGVDYKTLYDDSASYINLVQKKKDGIFEHWMGMFVPEGPEVPERFEAIDFPKLKLAVCSVYGKRNEIANYETECSNKLTEEGFTPENTRWYFRRFNWRSFFETDIYGKRILEYCYFT